MPAKRPTNDPRTICILRQAARLDRRSGRLDHVDVDELLAVQLLRDPPVPSIYSSGRGVLDLSRPAAQHAGMIWSFLCSLISAFKTRRGLALENLALRQQLTVLDRSVKRPRLSDVDRGFWVLLRRIWTDWESVLRIVKLETVVRWHRSGFRRYWTWKSRRGRAGRPPVAPKIRELIRDMSLANPLWGRRACTVSLRSLACPFPRSPFPSTWFGIVSHPLRRGGAFSIIICKIWCPSTSSLCRPQPSGSCSCSSSFVTIVAVSFTSISRNILPPSGRRNKWSMLFHGTRRLVTCSGIGIKSTERTSTVASRVSGSSRSVRHRAPRGKIRSSKESLVPFAATVSTT